MAVAACKLQALHDITAQQNISAYFSNLSVQVHGDWNNQLECNSWSSRVNRLDFTLIAREFCVSKIIIRGWVASVIDSDFYNHNCWGMYTYALSRSHLYIFVTRLEEIIS